MMADYRISSPTDPRAPAPLLLHGRQVPRLLHHHHRLLARPDRRHLRRLLDRPLPAHRWQGPSDRGLLFPPQVNEKRMKNFFFLLCSGWNVKERISMEKLGWKYQNPGLTSSYFFFDRLGFGFRCLGERVAIRVQFHILDFSLFLSSYRASKCHIPNNPFFNITLPLPNHMDGHFFFNCFFDWCWVCEGCDLQMMWYGSFSILYQVCWIPSWRRQIWMWPFGTHFSSYFHHCLFFLLHFTVMINISALNYCFHFARDDR